ncbi:MotA/TolQ/ExbB proton channel family protein [Rubritalea marina]|uniref:MotA/TolQ/ExbB proton channel family protein n=1 Tax=Rubritalea marina TaxID=361055 RepID=UPI00037221E5|nr:MotA/TolQ/ExbB proton channel family protein [Rubritalea marina]
MNWFFIIYRELLSILQQGGIVFVGILLVGAWMYHIILSTWFALRPIERELGAMDSPMVGQRDEEDVFRFFEVFKLQNLAWLDRRMPVIGVMVGVCTLAGLLGTVSGMLVTFSSMASSDGGKPMEKIAAGISEAMITTQAGLLIALPAVFAFALLKLRLKRVHDMLEQCQSRQVRWMQLKGARHA